MGRPPEGLDYFDPFNVGIHGITADMVAGQLRWWDRLPAIIDFIDGDVVVAHNASSDTSVIRGACDVDGMSWPELEYLCTLVMSRSALRLPSYKLPFVLRALGFTIADHHNALADAHGVVEVISGLSTRSAVADLEALALELGVSPGAVRGDCYWGCSASGRVARRNPAARSLREPLPDTGLDPDNYLYGRVVVFTGSLHSMSRKVAKAECARLGAIPASDITKHTNVLVLGDVNPAVLSPGARLTGKAAKAVALQAKGQDIEVMTEDEFLRCLDGETLPPD